MDVATRPEVDPSVEDVNNRDGRDDSMDQALLGRTNAMPKLYRVTRYLDSYFWLTGYQKFYFSK